MKVRVLFADTATKPTNVHCL